MKLEINEVYHEYIIRVVIFSIFLFKGQIRKPNVYKASVLAFVNKRLPWKINLYIDTGEKMSIEDERDLILDEILNGVKAEYLKSVSIVLTTPLKKNCVVCIDLTDEKKYENHIYS
jgi:hypothetical protein